MKRNDLFNKCSMDALAFSEGGLEKISLFALRLKRGLIQIVYNEYEQRNSCESYFITGQGIAVEYINPKGLQGEYVDEDDVTLVYVLSLCFKYMCWKGGSI